jgi:cytochrome c biogenesis factor
MTNYLYRTLQIGVVLLAAGTVLGGVWANYSWGRFWGWDPKETWALIALLGYLTVLHGRFAGWLGPFGFAVASTIAFLGVLMAWYGVNFVLAAGLHSYGFGGGGLPYVAAAVVFDIAILAGLTVAYYKNKKEMLGVGLSFPRKRESSSGSPIKIRQTTRTDPPSLWRTFGDDIVESH